MDRLTFAVLSDSLAEIRRVTARCGRKEPLNILLLRQHFTVWERGVLLNAACFLLDFPRVSIDIPNRAFVIAQRVVSTEFANGWADELVAASMGGAPWRTQFIAECLHCRRPATWRPIVSSPEDLPPEFCWRYDRPENHVPLCRRCIARLAYREPAARLDLVSALWGARFEAFYRWHKAFTGGLLPENWDRSLYPLWPAEFGGATWAAGSGALEDSEPQMFYGVSRSRCHMNRLAAFLGEARAVEIFRLKDKTDYEPVLTPLDVGTVQAIGALS